MLGFVSIFTFLFGIPLGFLFNIFGNYGVAVIVFTILINILLFPLAIKRQKNMTVSLKYESQKYELRKKYGKDPQKFGIELMNLNQKEGINPLKGCFNLSIFTMIILFTGISSTMQKPLTSVIKISSEKIKMLSEEIGNPNDKSSKNSYELQILKKIDQLKNNTGILSIQEEEKIEKLSKGFKFLGLNLLNIPKQSSFNEYLWILPIICLFTLILSIYTSQKITMEVQVGKPNIGIYFMCLFQAWIVFTTYGAIGVYWIVSSLIGTLQMLIIDKYFSMYVKNARNESKLYNNLLTEKI